MCCGIVGDTEASPVPSPPRKSRRRLIEIRTLKVIADVAAQKKRRKLDLMTTEGRIGVANDQIELISAPGTPPGKETEVKDDVGVEEVAGSGGGARFGVTSVRGRRREMEDAVSIRGSFCRGFDFYGVFDGHGCSHVAMKCKDRMHEIVKEEIERGGGDGVSTNQWEEAMRRSFARMDKEVNETTMAATVCCGCKCELRTPQRDAVGSTAVVAVVTTDKIVVPNCGDSRAVLCRNGVAIPLSSDHKPDRPDELDRILAAGGRVIYWDGARVLGVLAMSRAIGDNYLKAYVISEPEVTVMERNTDDECLILATDGLWDVVSNETACGVARMCLSARGSSSPAQSPGSCEANVVSAIAGENSDKACSDASILLTKLALARHSSDNVSVVVVDLRMRLHPINNHPFSY